MGGGFVMADDFESCKRRHPAYLGKEKRVFLELMRRNMQSEPDERTIHREKPHMRWRF